MKEVQIDEAIRRDRKLLEDVERASEFFDQVIGPAASKVTVRWGFFEERGERSLELKISDGSASSSEIIPEALLSPGSRSRLRWMINWLWGGLLQEQSHQQMARLKLAIDELVAEGK